MEFMSRGVRAVNGQPEGNQTGTTKNKAPRGGFARILTTLLVGGALILLIALTSSLIFGEGTKEESYVNDNKFQAVFLNGGQVYFGKIRSLNNKYLTMDSIYYLRVNQQVQPNQNTANAAAQDISLAKLGCELHGPEDTMIINREQVTFWENLKGDGQVATAIDKFVKENPDGQKCETTNASTTPTTTAPTTTTPTTTTPTTTTPTVKKP